MKYNPTTPWHMTYTARFKPLHKSQIEAIEIALHDSMKAELHEINDAMAGIAGSWQHERVPNMGDIAQAIKAIRGELTCNVTTPNYVDFYKGDVKGETTMRDLKAYLTHRPPPDRVWEVICIPLRADQCRELQRHCDNSGIAYSRFVPPRRIDRHPLMITAIANSTPGPRIEPKEVERVF